MKIFTYLSILILLIATPVFAGNDTDNPGELATDGRGIRVQGFAPNPEFSRSYSVGNKGFACYSTYTGTLNRRVAVQSVVADSSGTPLSSMLFFNGSEANRYPNTEAMIVVWKSVDRVCQRKYSSATPGTAYFLAQ